MQQRRKIATHCDDRHRRDHSRNSNRTCARKGSPAYDKCFLMIHYAISLAQKVNGLVNSVISVFVSPFLVLYYGRNRRIIA